jgi:hypothetical protein
LSVILRNWQTCLGCRGLGPGGFLRFVAPDGEGHALAGLHQEAQKGLLQPLSIWGWAQRAA